MRGPTIYSRGSADRCRANPVNQMPIPRLWMTGAATWPGGGVSGSSGHVIAQELLASTPRA
jgi:phytoene dehydrogenase-like protein